MVCSNLLESFQSNVISGKKSLFMMQSVLQSQIVDEIRTTVQQR